MADAEIPSLPRSEWLRPQDTVAVLAHGRWGHPTAKTGVALLRYGRAVPVAVLDQEQADPNGRSRDARATYPNGAADPIDPKQRRAVPFVSRLQDLLDDPSLRVPTRLVIGVAPPGGRLPREWRDDVVTALRAGIPVLSGLHDFLRDDSEFARLARETGTPLVDLRAETGPDVVLSGRGRHNPIPVVLVVGTDSSSGKMTATVELHHAARRAGLRSAWVATGQTGLLLDPDAGVALDHAIIDFAPGAVETAVLQAARLDDEGRPTPESPDVIWVEGQGALSHPGYGPVAMALHYGAYPTALVMCHVQDRSERNYPGPYESFAMPSLADEIRLNERVSEVYGGAKVVAISVVSMSSAGDEAARAVAAIEAATGLPAADLFADGPERIIGAVADALGLAARAAPARATLHD